MWKGSVKDSVTGQTSIRTRHTGSDRSGNSMLAVLINIFVTKKLTRQHGEAPFDFQRKNEPQFCDATKFKNFVEFHATTVGSV